MGLFKEQKMAKGTRRKHSAAFKAKVALAASIINPDLSVLRINLALMERIDKLHLLAAVGKCVKQPV
jgi:hypothetical protein